MASAARELSAKIFGNAKYAEIVVTLAEVSAPITAQEIARRTAITYSLVRDVLGRLVDAGLITPGERDHDRAPLRYKICDSDLWRCVLGTAQLVYQPSEELIATKPSNADGR